MTYPAEGKSLSTFRLRKRTPGTFVLVPFPKQGRSIRCQGQLEAATAQILAGCPLVREIQEQPLAIWYSWHEEAGVITLLDGPPTKAFRKANRCSYIVPDFLVTMQSGAKRLIEVKPSTKLGQPFVERKMSVARLYAKCHGWTFHIVTERELFPKPLLANVRLLNRFRRLSADPRCTARIEAVVADRPTTIGELLHCLTIEADAPFMKATVLHLIAIEQLAIDPRFTPITTDTQLYPGGACPWDPFDSVWEPSGSATNGCFASSANSVPISTSPKT
jgi:hypothetical protein